MVRFWVVQGCLPPPGVLKQAAWRRLRLVLSNGLRDQLPDSNRLLRPGSCGAVAKSPWRPMGGVSPSTMEKPLMGGVCPYPVPHSLYVYGYRLTWQVGGRLRQCRYSVPHPQYERPFLRVAFSCSNAFNSRHLHHVYSSNVNAKHTHTHTHTNRQTHSKFLPRCPENRPNQK